VKEALDTCSTCQKFGKPTAPPSVSQPMARDFNDVIAVDLAVWNGRLFYKITDLFSRYTQAAFVKNKKASTMVNTLTSIWLRYFGAPNAILCDFGSENISKQFVEFCEDRDIEIRPVPPQAQFANGVVEKTGHTLKEIMSKIQEDIPRSDFQVYLDGAIEAFNSVTHIEGWTPLQIVVAKGERRLRENEAFDEMNAVPRRIAAIHVARQEA